MYIWGPFKRLDLNEFAKEMLKKLIFDHRGGMGEGWPKPNYHSDFKINQK